MLGGGTLENPFLIETAQDLNNVKNNTSAHYKLANDIDLSSYASWTAIPTFKGTFDGDGHVVYNIKYNNNKMSYYGLFYALVNATVKNLGLKNVNIIGNQIIGALAGSCHNSNVENCYSNGSVTGRSYVGGLFGIVSGNTTINNCYAHCKVHGTETSSSETNARAVGGLIGLFNNTAVVENCYSIGKVTNVTNTANGLIGYQSVSDLANVTIKNSFWDVEQSGTSVSVGGGVGVTTSQMKDQSTFVGWSFSKVWEFIGDYPTLRVFSGNINLINEATIKIQSFLNPVQARTSVSKHSVMKSTSHLKSISTHSNKSVKRLLNVNSSIKSIHTISNGYFARKFKVVAQSYINKIEAATAITKKKVLHSSTQIQSINASTINHKKKRSIVNTHVRQITTESMRSDFLKRLIRVSSNINPFASKVAHNKRKQLNTTSYVRAVKSDVVANKSKSTIVQASVSSFIKKIKSVVTSQFLKVPTYKEIELDVSYEVHQSTISVLEHDSTLEANTLHVNEVNENGDIRRYSTF